MKKFCAVIIVIMLCIVPGTCFAQALSGSYSKSENIFRIFELSDNNYIFHIETTQNGERMHLYGDGTMPNNISINYNGKNSIAKISFENSSISLNQLDNNIGFNLSGTYDKSSFNFVLNQHLAKALLNSLPKMATGLYNDYSCSVSPLKKDLYYEVTADNKTFLVGKNIEFIYRVESSLDLIYGINSPLIVSKDGSLLESKSNKVQETSTTKAYKVEESTLTTATSTPKEDDNWFQKNIIIIGAVIFFIIIALIGIIIILLKKEDE